MRLAGLDENKNYLLVGTNTIIGGDALMNVELNVPQLDGDHRSYIWRFKAV